MTYSLLLATVLLISSAKGDFLLDSYEDNSTVRIKNLPEVPSMNKWSGSYGGPNNDHANMIQQTSDGGYIIIGDTRSYAENGDQVDIWLIKLDENGKTNWSKVIGTNPVNNSYAVQQTDDGGYIILGITTHFGNGCVWLIKVDSFGDYVWDKKYGDIGGDMGYSIDQTLDGGYIVCGASGITGNIDFWLMKTDAAGNTNWTRTIGTDYYEAFISVQQTSDDGYIAVGNIELESGYNDILLAKFNSSGSSNWTRCYGDSVHDFTANMIRQTSDGGYIITGTADTNTIANYDALLIKLDDAGNPDWQRFYDYSIGDAGETVRQTSDGGYIIGGYIYSDTSDLDGWLAKTDIDGNIEWSKVYDVNGYRDLISSIIETSDGGYISAGMMTFYDGSFLPTNVWVLKTDENGDIE